MSEDTIKEEMIGMLHLRTAPGGFVPEAEALRGPFEHEDSRMYGFCEGCGLLTEISQKGIELFIELSKAPLPGEQMYARFNRCPFCNIEGYKEVKFLSIPTE